MSNGISNIEAAKSFNAGDRVSFFDKRKQKIAQGTVIGAGAFVGTIQVKPDKFSKLSVMHPSFPASELTKLPLAGNSDTAAIESLRELFEWMRSHCGPADGVHEMLCRAHAILGNR